MKHPQVIVSLQAELDGLQTEINDCVEGLGDPLMTRREAKIIRNKVLEYEELVKQYKSGIRVLEMFDEMTVDEVIK